MIKEKVMVAALLIPLVNGVMMPVASANVSSEESTKSSLSNQSFVAPQINWADWQTYSKPLVYNSKTETKGFVTGARYGLSTINIWNASGDSSLGDTVPEIHIGTVTAYVAETGVSSAFAKNAPTVKHENGKTTTLPKIPDGAFKVTETSLPNIDSQIKGTVEFPLDLDVSYTDKLTLKDLQVNYNYNGPGRSTSIIGPTSVQQAETMLAHVYYMDSETGQEISSVPFDKLGENKSTGDSVTAVARDLTSLGYQYSGQYSYVTPTDETVQNGDTSTLNLQHGDWNDTSTNTGKQAIVFWYNQVPIKAENVTVKYVDTDGNNIAGIDDDVLTGNVGDPYQSEAKSIDGWTLKTTPENANGTFTDKPQTVTYVYERTDAAPVTVKYEDADGNSLADSDTLNGKIGLPYQSEAKSIDGWTLKTTPENANGTFTDKPQTVTYVYEKQLQPIPVKPVLPINPDNDNDKENVAPIHHQNRNIDLPETSAKGTILIGIYGIVITSMLVLVTWMRKQRD